MRDVLLFLCSPFLIAAFYLAIYSGKYYNQYLEWYYTKRKIPFWKKHDKFYPIVKRKMK